MKLLVIDMQKGLVVSDLYNKDKIVNNIIKLIDQARKNNVEVIYFKHDAGSGSGLTEGDDDFELFPLVEAKKDEKVYIKTINSCFSVGEFRDYLESINEKELMIVGVQTEFCIDATIKSAFERGFKVYVPSFTNSTFDNGYMKASKIYKFYNEWVWPGMFSEYITMKEALKLLRLKK